MFCFIFFFSSRRRHTVLVGAWSSDVCSSILHGESTGSDVSIRFSADGFRALFGIASELGRRAGGDLEGDAGGEGENDADADDLDDARGEGVEA